VKIKFHRLVQSDLNRILKGYAEVSRELENDFYKEFMRSLTKVNENPKLYHFEPGGLRRCNLKRFPHHFLYDTRGEDVRLWVLRHNKQRPGHGKRRFRK